MADKEIIREVPADGGLGNIVIGMLIALVIEAVIWAIASGRMNNTREVPMDDNVRIEVDGTIPVPTDTTIPSSTDGSTSTNPTRMPPSDTSTNPTSMPPSDTTNTTP